MNTATIEASAPTPEKASQLFPVSLDSRERVTLVMAPFERYSTFPKAIANLYQKTDWPFDLIVVEGNAPEGIQRPLERLETFHSNIKVIYSYHTPLGGEAYNLALPHIKTDYVFFMDNEINLTKGWLTRLMTTARTQEADIICPVVRRGQSLTYTPCFRYTSRPSTKYARTPYDIRNRNRFRHSWSYLSSPHDIRPLHTHGMLWNKKALESLKQFDEHVCAPLTGLDLNIRARAKGLEILIDTNTQIKRDFPLHLYSNETKLFEKQWNKEMALESADYLKSKWNIDFDGALFTGWLEEKKRCRAHKKASSLLWDTHDLVQSGVQSFRTNLKKTIHSLISL